MANDEARKATQTLFDSFWRNRPIQEAVTLSLQELAEGFEKPVTAGMLRLYTAALAEFCRPEIVQAFARATEECKFFPSPATLREFSGRPVSGDPVAAEAKAELLKLLEGMRSKHGPMLKPLLGRILYGTEADPKDAEGNRLASPIYGESTVFPIARRTEAALVRLGWGDSQAGIAVIADHPAVRRKQPESADEQYRQNQLRVGDEILKRFTEAYRDVQ